MGSVVGEKVTRCFERALERKLPALVLTCTGGARMQEGILSLMQMAKTSIACARLHEARLPYISVLTDPSTAGVMASYASLGDVLIAEPDALIGFAGPRVIEQTINQILPMGFQRSKFVLDHGFLDAVVHRRDLKEAIAHFLGLFLESLSMGGVHLEQNPEDWKNQYPDGSQESEARVLNGQGSGMEDEMTNVAPPPKRPKTTPPASAPKRPKTTPPASAPKRPKTTPPASAPKRPKTTPPASAPKRPKTTPPASAPKRPKTTPPASAPKRPKTTPPASAPKRPKTTPPASAPKRPKAASGSRRSTRAQTEKTTDSADRKDEDTSPTAMDNSTSTKTRPARSKTSRSKTSRSKTSRSKTKSLKKDD